MPVQRVRIMRPQRERPRVRPDEVGMELGDAEVVDGLVFAGVEEVVDGGPLAVVAEQAVAGLEVAGSRPSLIVEPEGMLGRGLDDLAAHVQRNDVGHADEDFLDNRDFQGRRRIVFIAGDDLAADLELLDELEADQRRDRIPRSRPGAAANGSAFAALRPVRPDRSRGPTRCVATRWS